MNSNVDYKKAQEIEMEEVVQNKSTNINNKYYIEKINNEVTYTWKNIDVIVAEKQDGLKKIKNMFNGSPKQFKQILKNGN